MPELKIAMVKIYFRKIVSFQFAVRMYKSYYLTDVLG